MSQCIHWLSTKAVPTAHLDIWAQLGKLPNESIIHLLWGAHKTPARYNQDWDEQKEQRPYWKNIG